MPIAMHRPLPSTNTKYYHNSKLSTTKMELNSEFPKQDKRVRKPLRTKFNSINCMATGMQQLAQLNVKWQS
jgi:hypothetical protein